MSSSKTVNLSLIPPIPNLKLALVGVVDNRLMEMTRRLGGMTGDKLRRLAKIGLQLSQKTCFFCGAESDPQLKKALKLKAIPWNELKLCPCMAVLRTGYKEYYPWKEKMLQIPEMIKAKELNPKTLMYSDRCVRPGCDNRLEVTAVMVANTVEKYKNHQQMRKCKTCRDEAARLAATRKQSPAQDMEVAAKSNAAIPHKKQRKNRQRADVAARLPLLATMEEQLKAKHTNADDLVKIDELPAVMVTVKRAN
jgi:hypothetical protein